MLKHFCGHPVLSVGVAGYRVAGLRLSAGGVSALPSASATAGAVLWPRPPREAPGGLFQRGEGGGQGKL